MKKHLKAVHKISLILRCRVGGCFSSFLSEAELDDHVSQVHTSSFLSDRVKEEEVYAPVAAEFTVPEMKQPENPRPAVVMGQGAFKPFQPTTIAPPAAAASSIPTDENHSKPIPIKRKPFSQSSILQFFH